VGPYSKGTSPIIFSKRVICKFTFHYTIQRIWSSSINVLLCRCNSTYSIPNGDLRFISNYVLSRTHVTNTTYDLFIKKLSLLHVQEPLGCRDSVVGISDWLRAGRPTGWSSSPERVKNFLFSTSSRGPPNLSSGYRGLFSRGVKLITHLLLAPRSRKCGSIHPLPHTPSWRSA
jgi:hypothetical protein